MLFSHKFVGPLLTFASEVAIGELVAAEVLMGINVRSIKDDEGGGAGGVRCGLHWGQGSWRRQRSWYRVFWYSLQTMANICAMVWYP